MQALVQLVDLMRPTRYEAGSVISREGSKGPTPLYIATAGRVLITWVVSRLINTPATSGGSRAVNATMPSGSFRHVTDRCSC